jgi:hypothetical protein
VDETVALVTNWNEFEKCFDISKAVDLGNSVTRKFLLVTNKYGTWRERDRGGGGTPIFFFCVGLVRSSL